MTQSGFYISTTLNVYSAHTGMDEIIDAVKDTTFCLEESGGKFQWKHNHAYYYQVSSSKPKMYRIF